MLTPTDVHLLVGLLTRISRPDGVEIELGNTIFDSAADEFRDVDLTVVSTDESGRVSAFEGIEVKHHKRPLDVTHVEQLCTKLRDMPSITSRGIVSASGFTSPSVRKAKYYGVVLYELRKVVPPIELNGVVIQTPSLKMQEDVRQWIGTPSVLFDLNPNVPAALESLIEGQGTITNKDGLPIEGVSTLHQLAERVLRIGAEQAQKQMPEGYFPAGTEKQVRLRVGLADAPVIHVRNERFEVVAATIEGIISSRIHVSESEFMILAEHGSNVPIVGYAIAKVHTGNLIGITVDNMRRISSIQIPVADRLLNKIYRRKVP